MFYVLYKYDLLELDAIFISQGLTTSPIYGWHLHVIWRFFIRNAGWRQTALYTWIAHLILVIVALVSIVMLISTLSLAWWLIGSLFAEQDDDITPAHKKMRVRSILIGTAAFVFNPKQFNEGDKWVIWTNAFTKDELVIRLNWDEHHYFHDSCIEYWVRKKRECPICHATTTLDQIVEARESINYKKVNHSQNDRSHDSNLKQRLSQRIFGTMELIDEED